MSTREHTAAASQAVHELRKLARAGNLEAVAAIRDIALHAIAILEVTDLGDVSKHSSRWPVAYDAILEIRKSDLARVEKLEVGSAIGIKLAGKNRGFSYDEQTGFALGVFHELDAIRTAPAGHLHAADEHPELAAPGVLSPEQAKRTWLNLAALLPPLSAGTVEEWTSAGMELCREDCQGDFEGFPWPACARVKIGKDTDGNGTARTAESAIYGKLKAGFQKLA